MGRSGRWKEELEGEGGGKRRKRGKEEEGRRKSTTLKSCSVISKNLPAISARTSPESEERKHEWGEREEGEKGRGSGEQVVG